MRLWQIRQLLIAVFVFAALAAQAQQREPAARSEGDRRIAQHEIQWASQLEARAKAGYQPNPQETARYQDIAKRLQRQSNTNSTPAKTGVRPEEKQWALQLESRVQAGYQPNAQETARYQDIRRRLR